MTILTRIRAFRHHQTLCKCHETDIAITTCDNDGPICRDGTLFPLPTQKFTYMYITLFEKLGLRLPFNTFEKELLTILNVCPRQLHPNSWPFITLFNSSPSITFSLGRLPLILVSISQPTIPTTIRRLGSLREKRLLIVYYIKYFIFIIYQKIKP